MTDPTEYLATIGDLLIGGRDAEARDVATRHLPFVPVKRQKRRYSESDALRVFVADGFRCRYFGQRLVFPGTLRLIGELLPDELPYHPNGRMDKCHLIHWILFPTVDHVVPVSRGGADDASNWVSTSMLRNAVKGHWTLEEIGWTLMPRFRHDAWDGLVGWYLRYTKEHPDTLASSFHKRWHRAAVRESQSVGAANRLVADR